MIGRDGLGGMMSMAAGVVDRRRASTEASLATRRQTAPTAPRIITASVTEIVTAIAIETTDAIETASEAVAATATDVNGTKCRNT
jgi:hypothetical protein